MAGQPLKLALLLISLTCSSSLDPTVTATPENVSGTSEDLPNVTNNDPSITALNEDTLLHPTVTATPENGTSTSKYLPDVTNNGPSFAALNGNTPSNKDTMTESMTKELMTSRASTKESNVSPEQEKSPADLVSQEDASTFPVDVMTSKDPASATVTPRPVNDSFTEPTDVLVTSHKDDETNDRGVTSSIHPPGETVGLPESVATEAPKNISSSTTKPKESEPTPGKLSDKKKTFILVVALIVILLLILVTVVVIIVRNKRRRGSQSFHNQSRSSKRQDVWAGQVPELGDGKMTQQPMGMENGMTGNKPVPGKEQEMITFISAEKKDDSVVEMNELGKDDVSEEKKPLLEDSSQVNEEPEKPPVEEQTPAPTVEQELV